MQEAVPPRTRSRSPPRTAPVAPAAVDLLQEHIQLQAKQYAHDHPSHYLAAYIVEDMGIAAKLTSILSADKPKPAGCFSSYERTQVRSPPYLLSSPDPHNHSLALIP